MGDTLASISGRLPENTFIHDKLMFSMLTPEIHDRLSKHQPGEIVLAGIETHICVLQTVLGKPRTLPHAKATANVTELLQEGFRVVVLADAVSASSVEEHNTALIRLRQAGAYVTSFESWLFATVQTASHPKFVVLEYVGSKQRLTDSSSGLSRYQLLSSRAGQQGLAKRKHHYRTQISVSYKHWCSFGVPFPPRSYCKFSKTPHELCSKESMPNSSSVASSQTGKLPGDWV